MQCNDVSSRGSGFIISGENHAIGKRIIITQTPKIKRISLSVPINFYAQSIIEKLRLGFNIYTSEASKLNKRFVKLLLSFGVAICALSVFFNYFTFATAIYNDSECVAVSSSADEFKKALNKATRWLGDSDSSFLGALRTSTVIYPKSKICDNSILGDKLILSSPDFKEAYQVSADGKPLFVASSQEEAKDVLDEYISSLSMNGKASTEEKIKYTKIITPITSILSKEECSTALSEGGGLDVLSVVSTSYEEVVPFDTQTEEDSSLYIGEKVTLTEGQTGTKKVFQETVYKNGLAQSSKISSENIIAKPVSKVVKIGTKEKEILKTGVIRPVQGGWISSNFGERWGKMHEGIDIAVSTGTTIIAAECGTVSYVSENAGGYGKYIEIDHGKGVRTSYAHLSKILVSVGQAVGAGEKIALSGNTGRSTGPHLHFEIINNGVKIDPKPYIKNI